MAPKQKRIHLRVFVPLVQDENNIQPIIKHIRYRRR